MRTEDPRPIRLDDYRAPDFTIDRVELDIHLVPDATRVASRLHIRRMPEAQAGAPLFLNGEHLKLRRIAMDGQELGTDRYTVSESGLTIPDCPDSFVLETEGEIDPAGNTALEGLYISRGIFCTQCEAEGFRKIAYFIDRPDVMALYRTRITAPKAAYPVLLANGNKVESGDLENGLHYAVWDDPYPKPSYLFALIAGDLGCLEDSFRTMSGRTVTLQIFASHEAVSRCAYAMDALKRAMAWDEKAYGREYDLDLFMVAAIDDFNFGAMENKGLNIFNSKLILASPETATDADYARIEAVVAHEYFHNWTGNRITCRDWFQLCLKEGLTVFREQGFCAHERSAPLARIEDVNFLRNRQFPEDDGPLAHPVRPSSFIKIDNFYTATVYEKGAELIRMLRKLIGEEAFAAGMNLYFQRCDGTAATVEDFIAAMTEASGRDLDDFMRWYGQAGTPRVTASGSYDPEAKTYTLTLRQETPPTPGQATKTPLPMPIETGLLGRGGAPLPLRLEGENLPAGDSRVLELTQAEQSFVFVDVPEPPVPSINRGFSAPVRLATGAGEADLLHLLAHDPDAFNRWEAGQELVMSLLIGGARAAESSPGPDTTHLIGALGRVVGDGGLDPAFKALLLQLPSEREVGSRMDVIEVDGIHRARTALRQRIGEKLAEPLLNLYETLKDDGVYDPAHGPSGRRDLRNTALGYLCALEAPETADLAYNQFLQAGNMTDRMAALTVLSNLDDSRRKDALAEFYDSWSGNDLVLDKWFSVQAVSTRTDTPQTVAALTRHQDFSLKNPNRVRALIGAFAMNNQVRFHDDGGAGYNVLVETVLALDPLNPNVAARLMGALENWQRFDSRRQGLMKAALENVRARDTISPNLYEICHRALADSGRA